MHKHFSISNIVIIAEPQYKKCFYWNTIYLPPLISALFIYACMHACMKHQISAERTETTLLSSIHAQLDGDIKYSEF